MEQIMGNCTVRKTNKSNCGRQCTNRKTKFKWSVNASLGYLAVTPPVFGNHSNRVNLQVWNYTILWQSQETEKWGRGEKCRECWGMVGERCNRRQLFDAAASTLNSLSSRQCRSAGDAHFPLLTVPVRAAPTPCLTRAASSTYLSTNQTILIRSPQGHIKTYVSPLLPFALWLIENGATLWESHKHFMLETLCDLPDSNRDLSPVWGWSSPIELGGICHHPKPSLSDESTC